MQDVVVSETRDDEREDNANLSNGVEARLRDGWLDTESAFPVFQIRVRRLTTRLYCVGKLYSRSMRLYSPCAGPTCWSWPVL